MYTILITDSNELTTTNKERIMRKSKLVDNLQFLTAPNYKDLDMTQFTACLEYRLPVTKNYRSEILELSDELYKDMLQYKLPIDTDLTTEPGDIEIQITFTWAELCDNGNVKQHVRKTSPTTLTVQPIADWSTFVSDESLTAIDQRIMKTDEQIAALEQMELDISKGKLDDLVVENNKIAGVANGEKQTEWDIVVPRINDGNYDGDYDGVLDLDNFDDSGESGNSGNGKHHHGKKPKFVEL